MDKGELATLLSSLRKGGGVMTGGGGNNKFLYGLCASDNGERWHSISGGTACLASSCRSL